MKRKLYWYNPEHLSFQPLSKLRAKEKIIYYGKQTGIVLVLTILLFHFSAFIFETPQEHYWKKKYSELQSNYKELDQEAKKIRQDLAQLESKDKEIYSYFIGDGNQPAAQFSQASIKNSSPKNAAALDKLHYKIKKLDKHYRYILALTQKQEGRMRALPAISPVPQDVLKRPPHGFGPRIDPVYHVPSFHQGIDMTARRGTPIYATADGKVTYAGHSIGGYGIKVEIDHGYQYATLYAHCSKVAVRKGEKVVRGQKIAEIGNTGKSIAPHLHYEVQIDGEPVNPASYIFNDLDLASYYQLLEAAARSTKSLD